MDVTVFFLRMHRLQWRQGVRILDSDWVPNLYNSFSWTIGHFGNYSFVRFVLLVRFYSPSIMAFFLRSGIADIGTGWDSGVVQKTGACKTWNGACCIMAYVCRVLQLLESLPFYDVCCVLVGVGAFRVSPVN